LKSSASAIDAESVTNIANVSRPFTRRILPFLRFTRQRQSDMNNRK